MIDGLRFAHPAVLLLLPLALLPFIARRRDRLDFTDLDLIDHDPLGGMIDLLWRALAALALLACIIALADPGRSIREWVNQGVGAEILILMDRSRSMDDTMLPADWRTVDPLSLRAQARSRGELKRDAAARLLREFVQRNRADRFALMYFSANPILILPFTTRDEPILAGIDAATIGRGLSDTDVGWALRAAIDQFENRPYNGSRTILLVSDGGADLDETTKTALRNGLARNRIALNWIYLRSINGADFESADNTTRAAPEIRLHEFFQTLSTPYRAWQAASPDDFAAAVDAFGALQEYPMDQLQTTPWRPWSDRLAAGAALLVLILAGLRAGAMRQWS